MLRDKSRIARASASQNAGNGAQKRAQPASKVCQRNRERTPHEAVRRQPLFGASPSRAKGRLAEASEERRASGSPGAKGAPRAGGAQRGGGGALLSLEFLPRGARPQLPLALLQAAHLRAS